MKMNRFLPVLAALVLPLTAGAQSGTAPSAPSPVLYAEADSPAIYSSSASSSLDEPVPASHAFAAAAAGAPAPAHVSGGSHLPLSGLAVAVKFGIAGIGFDVATPLVPGWINLRGGASFFSYSPVITVDNINIDGSIKFQNASAMVDIFPFHGRFRISGGMTVYNNTYLAATLNVPGGTSFTLGNTKYYSDPNDPITGAGTFTFGGRTAPRVSIGTGNMLPRKGRWTFEGELGVQFITQPTVVYSISGAGCPASGETTMPPCGAVATSDIAQEQTNLQNDLMDLRYFPIASIGLGFKIH
jgi:hypothetical protein